MTWLETLWWSVVPRTGGRLSRTLLFALSEGVYLTAWRRVAALAPLGVLLLGFLLGWLRVGVTTVFTESPIVLVLAVASGMVAGLLGASFTVGHAAGDLLRGGDHGLLSGPALADLLLLHAGLVIAYAALAMLAVGLPLVVRGLRAQLPALEHLPDLRVGLDIMLGALASAVLVYLYVQALPMLIRPLFVWQGRTPAVEAVATVQAIPWLFAVVAGVVTGLRVLLEYGAAVLGFPEIERHAAALDAAAARPGVWERLPAPVRVVLASLLGTAALAGLLMTWTETLVLLGGLVAVNALRTLVPPLVPAWPALAERIPPVARLPAALLLAFAVTGRLLAGRLNGVSFLPLILAFLVSLACFALCFPATTPRPAPAPAGSDSWRPAPSGTPAARPPERDS